MSKRVYPTKRYINIFAKKWNLTQEEKLNVLCRFIDLARLEQFPAEDLRDFLEEHVPKGHKKTYEK